MHGGKRCAQSNYMSFQAIAILLAMLLEESCRRFNNDVYKQIIDFCLEKNRGEI